MKSLLILITVLCLQYLLFLFCFRPYILRWGAEHKEIAMEMPGDHFGEAISCTRAIEINKPMKEVWPYVTAIGADRNGFYSYDFLEHLLGYELVKGEKSLNRDMPIGRLVPYDKPDSRRNHHEGFRVIAVEEGRSFVLQGWGEFRLQNMNATHTRLLVRTHWKKTPQLTDKLVQSLFDIGHFIMERRMMLGIKDSAELAGKYSHPAADIIWFLSIVLSGLAGLLLVFISVNQYQLILPSIFLIIWQFFVLVINPLLLPGIAIVLLAAAFVWLSRSCMLQA
jgi:hypothetical protein